jgi:hypothetical protein
LCYLSSHYKGTHTSSAVSDLALLGDLVNLQSLNMDSCSVVSDLAPLGNLVNLQSLNMDSCSAVSDLAPLGALGNLQSLNMDSCSAVSDLAPLGALINMHTPLSACGQLQDNSTEQARARESTLPKPSTTL